MAWVKFVVIVIAKAFCASILVFSWAKAFNGYRVSGGTKMDGSKGKEVSGLGEGQ